jgi:hypothetical protein
MRVVDKYLKWLFGEKKLEKGLKISEMALAPLFTPFALAQDLMSKRKKAKS